jgi:hypothetical protein
MTGNHGFHAPCRGGVGCRARGFDEVGELGGGQIGEVVKAHAGVCKSMTCPVIRALSVRLGRGEAGAWRKHPEGDFEVVSEAHRAPGRVNRAAG